MTVNTDPLCPQQHTHPKHSPNRCIFCEYGAAVRADALNAAREAVKGVNWFNDEGKMLSAVVATADSIAAIDALKEQR